MLFRSDSDIALGAGFSEARLTIDPPEDVSADPELSAEALELERLKAENNALRQELEQLKTQWNSALSDASSRAEAEAARKHKNDDQRRSCALEEALREARDIYAEHLGGQIEAMARDLACEALSSLVEIQASEAEWLARIIAQRLSRMRQAVSPRIHVAPADLEALASLLPKESSIVADDQVTSGTAFIRLALGEIVIDPVEGLGRVLATIKPEPLNG